MLFIYYPKCSTCQKAKKWLDEHKIEYTERHIVEENPSYEELKEWYNKSGFPLKKFFNTSGMLYKEMHLKDKLQEMSEEEQLKLLATNGMLIKRPLLIDGNKALIGFKETQWTENIKAESKETEMTLSERFEFRDIRPDEADQAATIEKICFPPNEACSEKDMKERTVAVPDLFLVAVDKGSGKIAGFLNGIATNEERLRDEFFTDASLHDPAGKNVMLLGLDVLPEYRGQGLARAIVEHYLKRENAKGRKEIILTCLDEKVEMYKKFGFIDKGISDSEWGGEKWHEMVYLI